MYVQSFRYALAGVIGAVRRGRNFRLMLAIFLPVIAAGFLFSISETEWLAVLLCAGGAFALELVNTAIEHAVDLTTERPHPLTKAAKDAAAGAVLVWCVLSAAIGFIIFIPYVSDYVANVAKQ